jgi:hypothetical protein
MAGMLNMDRRERRLVDLAEVGWVPSPNGDVHRKMLERQHAETGWATSVVRYPEGSHFPQHKHGGGEEFLVLEGVFSDESGDYPALSYVRNPIGSVHSPYSTKGCVIFVKLFQMFPEQRHSSLLHLAPDKSRPLFEDDHETVWLRYANASETIDLAGTEVFVVSGTATVNNVRYKAWSWLRAAGHDTAQAELDPGTLLYCKRGHLAV